MVYVCRLNNIRFLCLAPSAALIIAEECSAENNSVTIAWQPPASSYVEGYVLELDDGNGGDFRVCTTIIIIILYSRRIDFSRKTILYNLPDADVPSDVRNH